MLNKLFAGSEARKIGRLAIQIGLPESAKLPSFTLKGGNFLVSLKEKAGAKFKLIDSELFVAIGDINYRINSWEEINIINEVYIEGMYNIGYSKPYIFVDIGMNVGVTSLYFAAKNNCLKTYSFEPFAKTIAMAKYNFSLNSFANKIQASQKGLGYPARKLSVQYSADFKGSVGKDGLGEHILGQQNLEMADMEIGDVYEELKPVFDGKENIIMKIDCEGAEYEILQRLNEMNVINRADAYLIEWHHKGPGELKNILHTNGFTTISFNEKSPDIGMLYAFKDC